MQRTILALVGCTLLFGSSAYGQFTATVSGHAHVSGLGFNPEIDGGFREESALLSAPGNASVRLFSAESAIQDASAFASASAIVGDGSLIYSVVAKKTGSGGFRASSNLTVGLTGAIETDGPSTLTMIFSDRNGGHFSSLSRTEPTTWAAADTSFGDGVLISASVNGSIVDTAVDSRSLFWGVGTPGPTGFGHMPGGNPNNSIRLPEPTVFERGNDPDPNFPGTNESIFSQPESIPGDETIRFEEGVDPQMVAGVNLTFPAMQGYGVGNPIYVGKQTGGENPLANISLIAASVASEPKAIGYVFHAPGVGFSEFSIVESFVGDTSFTLYAGDQEFDLSTGTVIDFIAELGASVETFTVAGLDSPQLVSERLPFLSSIQFAAAGVVDFEVYSLAASVPEPTTLALAAFVTVGFLARRR